jgi:hypothetical protein
MNQKEVDEGGVDNFIFFFKDLPVPNFYACK